MRVSVVLGLASLALACERGRAPRASDPGPQVGTTEVTSVELPVDPGAFAERLRAGAAEGGEVEPPRGLVELAVPGQPMSFLVGAPPRVAPRIVYFHGMCGGPEGTLSSFERTARESGGALGLTGDKPCGAGRHSFTVDAGLQQRRLERALEAIDAPPEARRLPEVVIGYSQGATVAERLVAAYSYPFVVLIGAPREPSPENLDAARAVVLVSGENDMAKSKMRAAKEACEAAGIPAHYIEVPGARHGELADGDAVIGEALAWMRAHARAAPGLTGR